MKKKKVCLPAVLLFCVGSAVGAPATLADTGLEYHLTMAEDGKTYEVWMRPVTTPKPDISLSAQLTIKVPHSAEFNAVKVVSGVEGVSWIESSRVNSPEEASDYDYISFSSIGLQADSARAYQWQAGEEKRVFSFTGEQGCVQGVRIMLDDDPFNVAGNSASTNAGNQFTNMGWGDVSENNFKGVYGDPPRCTQ